MSLDGQEPIVFVRLAAGLNGDEARAEPRGDRRIGDGGELQVAIAVTDAGDGSDDGGGSSAEGFGKFSSGMRGENLVNGNLAFLRGNAHLAEQSESGVARYAGEDCAAERRCDRFAIENEENIHNAGFLDVAALDAVEPENIVKASFLGEARGEEATGVIAGGFAIAGSAGKGANIALFGEQANRLRKVRADGTGHDDKAKAIGGTNEKSVVDAKVSWANVEGTAFAMRDPVAIEADQLRDALEEEWLWNSGHGQARGGTV